MASAASSCGHWVRASLEQFVAAAGFTVTPLEPTENTGEFGQADMAVWEWLEVPAVGSGGRGTPLRDLATTLRTRNDGLRLAQLFANNVPRSSTPCPTA